MGFTRELRAIRARQVSLISYDINKAYNFCGTFDRNDHVCLHGMAL